MQTLWIIENLVWENCTHQVLLLEDLTYNYGLKCHPQHDHFLLLCMLQIPNLYSSRLMGKIVQFCPPLFYLFPAGTSGSNWVPPGVVGWPGRIIPTKHTVLKKITILLSALGNKNVYSRGSVIVVQFCLTKRFPRHFMIFSEKIKFQMGKMTITYFINSNIQVCFALVFSSESLCEWWYWWWVDGVIQL